MPAIISLVENGETAQIVDSEIADEQIRKLARARGWRSATYTPLMNQGTFIGFIVCTRRETGMLADHHVQLLRTFADQAVIAIENVRLFDEVQAKTRDLSEALTYQTGSANILSVIASSPTDVGPVLQAIVESACELCEAYDAGRAHEGWRRLALLRAPAVMAFQLLFMGRHPFVGGFLGGSDMPIEKAIEEFRFAYSSDRNRTRMEAATA